MSFGCEQDVNVMEMTFAKLNLSHIYDLSPSWLVNVHQIARFYRLEIEGICDLFVRYQYHVNVFNLNKLKSQVLLHVKNNSIHQI